MAPDTPDGFTAAISATGTAAGPNTFRRVGRSRLPTRSTAALPPAPENSFRTVATRFAGTPAIQKAGVDAPVRQRLDRRVPRAPTPVRHSMSVTSRAGGPIQTCGGPGHRHTDRDEARVLTGSGGRVASRAM